MRSIFGASGLAAMVACVICLGVPTGARAECVTDETTQDDGSTLRQTYCREGDGEFELVDANSRAAAREAPPAPAAAIGQPARSSSLDAQMDAIVGLDARNWMMHRYDAGSLHNARVLERSRDGRTMKLSGDYTYNGGLTGWVQMQIRNDAVSCIQFWNDVGCRPLGVPLGMQVTGALITAAVVASVTTPGSAGYGSYGSTTTREDPGPRPQTQGDPPPTDRAPPVTPIGGENGLYGCTQPPCM